MARAGLRPPERVERWDNLHGTYLTGRSYIDGVDALAAEVEGRWGAGRLRLLVDATLREKFDRQRVLMRRAIEDGALEDVRRECARMTLALATLDRAAQQAGHEPLPPQVMEAAMADGTVLAIVPDGARAAMVPREGRKVAVYTIDEAAELIGKLPGVNEAKIAWPGATVTKVRRTVADPLDGIRAPPNSFDDPVEDLWPQEGLS